MEKDNPHGKEINWLKKELYLVESSIITPHFKSVISNIGELLIGNEKELSPAEVISQGRLLADKPDVFISYLETNPWLSLTDAVVKWVVVKLHYDCLVAGESRVKHAKKILQKAGLSLFIPKGLPRRIKETDLLRFWEQDPQVLLNEVLFYENLIGQFYNPPYHTKDRTERDRKKQDIENAFQYIFKEPMPKDLIFGERDKELLTIALAFVSYKNGVPFEGLKNLYMKNPNKTTEIEIRDGEYISGDDFIKKYRRLKSIKAVLLEREEELKKPLTNRKK